MAPVGRSRSPRHRAHKAATHRRPHPSPAMTHFSASPTLGAHRPAGAPSKALCATHHRGDRRGRAAAGPTAGGAFQGSR